MNLQGHIRRPRLDDQLMGHAEGHVSEFVGVGQSVSADYSLVELTTTLATLVEVSTIVG